MLDELLEVFDHDRKRDPNAPKQKGIRGFLNRLRETDDDDRRYTATSDQRPYRDDDGGRRYASTSEQRPYRKDDDDDDRYERSDPNRRRSRERDGFDFFDD